MIEGASLVIVFVYPADVYGCGFYRLIGPAQALAEQGHDVRIVLPTDRADSLSGEIDTRTNRVVDVKVAPEADVVVLQRVTSSQVMQAIPHLRRQGVAVVVDMDDDMSKIDPSNPAFTGLHPAFGRSSEHNWNNAARACDLATVVTVSTPALLSVYARNRPGHVLTNCVPAAYLDIEHPAEADTFGWPGSTHSHPNDLAVVGPAVARLIRGGYAYRGVGPVDDLRQALGLDADPDVTGPVSMEDWAPTLAGMGVGMAPLADTEFNRAKSWLKILELSAVGVPWVASPRDEYRRFVGRTAGVGAFAERPNDWFSRIGQLLRSPSLREDRSAAGRELAARHTMEGNAWRWWEAWDLARGIERRAAPSVFAKRGATA